METPDLASIVMQMISGLATSAGTSVGTAAGEEVSRLVRDRLGRSQEGRAALTQLDQEPGSSEAESQVRTVLTRALADDPDFATRLETAATQNTLHAGRDMTVQTVSVSSSTVKGTINIGPLTITKSRGAYLALIAAVIVLALLLVLGTYGTVQAIFINDSPATRSTDSTTAPHAGNGLKLKPITTKNAAKAIMPDQSALPVGWSAAGEPDVTDEGAAPLEGGIELTGPDYGITLEVGFFETAASASKTLNRSDILAGWEIDQHSESLAMPKIGDGSMAFIDYTPSDHVAGMVAAARIGTIMCQLAATDTVDPADYADEVFAFTRMCIQRAEQGQQGKTPDAVVETG
ncbi:hypothetical protein OG887_44645 (plasmid) [Streptomyces sp. NBC_00053]|uniref:hypothetical protein n=1 Tax=unclassified Streptomyces TaxID=2593676 RepID=UPI00224D7367|nr:MULTISPECIES: hypothetical protein [unclassified Streptomyces]MCX4852128.1 hypothetical protein [Streptomyces sp. NBC_00893]MCX5506070.1 hypothetical protein [Streptomyces sp. NBC_00052]MCX5554274.1 hypothetical protein [Streptomyces sp. NBC_00051]WSP52974.1 hypothetical protein OG348_45830 [Streptomyces sp. NBC_01243]